MLKSSIIKRNFLYVILFFITFSLQGFDLSSALCFICIPFINHRILLDKLKVYLIYRSVFSFYVLCFISMALNEVEINQSIRFIATFILFLFITTNNLLSQKLLKNYILIIVTGLIIQNLIGLFLVFLLGINEIPGFKPLTTNFRYGGFYGGTILSIFMASILIISLCNKTIIRSKILKMVMYFVFFVCITITLTRSGWGTAFAGIFLLWSLNFRVTNLGRYVANSVKVLGGGLILLVLLPQSVDDRFEIRRSIEDRIFIDTLGTSSWAELDRGTFRYPLVLISEIGVTPFGIGLGQVEKEGGKIFGLALNYSNLGAHNTFVHVLLDFGLLPFIAFLISNILIVSYFMGRYKIIRRSYGFGCFIAYLSLFLPAMFQDLIIFLPISLMPIFCIAFITNKSGIVKQ